MYITIQGPSICERVIRSIRNLFEKPLFQSGKSDCLSELPSVIKQYNNTIHQSTKMTPIDGSQKTNEKTTHFIFQDKRNFI